MLQFFKLFLGLIISFGTLVCKFGNKNVFLMLWHFLWNFFDFPIFSIYRKWEFSIFPKIVSATIFGLITHIINLFQTVRFQKARLYIFCILHKIKGFIDTTTLWKPFDVTYLQHESVSKRGGGQIFSKNYFVRKQLFCHRLSRKYYKMFIAT